MTAPGLIELRTGLTAALTPMLPKDQAHRLADIIVMAIRANQATALRSVADYADTQAGQIGADTLRRIADSLDHGAGLDHGADPW